MLYFEVFTAIGLGLILTVARLFYSTKVRN